MKNDYLGIVFDDAMPEKIPNLCVFTFVFLAQILYLLSDSPLFSLEMLRIQTNVNRMAPVIFLIFGDVFFLLFNCFRNFRGNSIYRIISAIAVILAWFVRVLFTHSQQYYPSLELSCRKERAKLLDENLWIMRVLVFTDF